MPRKIDPANIGTSVVNSGVGFGGMSVTNDAESVYLEVTKQHPNHRVIYRDTMGLWDEITMTEDGDLNFKAYHG